MCKIGFWLGIENQSNSLEKIKKEEVNGNIKAEKGRKGWKGKKKGSSALLTLIGSSHDSLYDKPHPKTQCIKANSWS